MSTPETPSQTAGPYVHLGLLAEGLAPLTTRVSAPALLLQGLVLDGAGEPLRDALVELWDGSTGQWLRSETDPQTGLYRFALAQPGAPFLSLYLLARGINLGLHTRAYLGEAPGDPLLASLGPRAATLMAQRQPQDGGELPTWRLDIRLHGAAETVFLDVQGTSARRDGA